MKFLLIIPVVLILAQLWLTWTSRTRRAPEIESTIAAHHRFTEAMGSQVSSAPDRTRLVRPAP